MGIVYPSEIQVFDTKGSTTADLF